MDYLILGMPLFIALFIFFLFTLSLYRALMKVPQEKHVGPSWLVWCSFIPVVQLFSLMYVLIYLIPSSLKSAAVTIDGKDEADHLAIIGTLIMGSLSFAFTTYMPLSLTVSIVLGLWYWHKVVLFRKMYLISGGDNSEQHSVNAQSI